MSALLMAVTGRLLASIWGMYMDGKRYEPGSHWFPGAHRLSLIHFCLA